MYYQNTTAQQSKNAVCAFQITVQTTFFYVGIISVEISRRSMLLVNN